MGASPEYDQFVEEARREIQAQVASVERQQREAAAFLLGAEGDQLAGQTNLE
jgi:hypothetical protein